MLRTAPLGLANWEARPARIVGWVSFVAIESYGSLAVALFWAFTNSTVDLEAAKASYGLVIAGAQIGAILGEERFLAPWCVERLAWFCVLSTPLLPPVPVPARWCAVVCGAVRCGVAKRERDCTLSSGELILSRVSLAAGCAACAVLRYSNGDGEL